MPANYAHYRFGVLSLPYLPADVRRPIQRFRQMYDVGLHGPDLFYYYSPFAKTTAGELGARFHGETGRECFTRVCGQLRKNPTEAGLAYLYGLLAHYCLDSALRPLVRAETAEGNLSPVELEVEFDRFLLDTDGKTPPCTQNTASHIRLTRGECVTVSEFYPPATPANISHSVKNMALAGKFLAGKNRKLLKNMVTVLAEEDAQRLMPEHANPKCLHLDKAMFDLYNQALERYPSMVEQLTAYMNYAAPLGEDFDETF